ncbi:MAG: Crp/Fnr family transcriptional regulator [Bacteroidota bacterium]
MTPSIDFLKNEIFKYEISLSQDEWESFESELSTVCFEKGDSIFASTEICKDLFFVSKGIVASSYDNENEHVINRFFSPNDICSNIVSLVKQTFTNDNIVAITRTEGVLIPSELFLESYLHSNSLGLFFRKRLLEVLLEDKMFISIKTMTGVEAKMNFLRDQYPEIYLNVPWKYIAEFIGVTPEWLSRYINRKQISIPAFSYGKNND